METAIILQDIPEEEESEQNTKRLARVDLLYMEAVLGPRIRKLLASQKKMCLRLDTILERLASQKCLTNGRS